MTEPKLEPIKKEKLDSMFSDEKEASKKNKKKSKKNKKKNQIDLFDYAKEKGLEINLQYEDVKPVEFDFQKINLNNNNKTNQAYNKQSNVEPKERKIENKEKEKEINKKNEKQKIKENKKDNKNANKNIENNYENNEEENDEEKYDNFKYNEIFKGDNNNYKEQNYQNFRNEDKNYYNNNYNNNNYNNNKNYYNKKNYNNNYYNYNDYKNYNNNNFKKKNNIAVEIPDNNFQNAEAQNNQNSNNNVNIQNQINNLNNIHNNQINQINIQNNIFNQYYQANLMSNYQAEMMRMKYFSNMEHLTSNLYFSEFYTPITESGVVGMLDDYLSEKNLNNDLYLRKNMDKETGNVPLDFILNLNKIKSMNFTEEKMIQLINKVGSDYIELINIDDKLYMRPKNYDNIKNNLISIEEIEKKATKQNNINLINNQSFPQQNMQMGMPPMYFFPVQPMMYYNPMMASSQQNQGNKPEPENDK